MNVRESCRILAVDDHAIVLNGLRTLTAQVSSIDWVGEAHSAAEALTALVTCQPDIVILDVRLGSEDGIALCAQMQAIRPGLRAIIFSAFSGDEEVYRALDAGARAYVLKEFAATEILTAIDHVRRGLRYLSGDVARHLAAHGPRISLTPRETMVLRAVGSGLRNKEVAKLLDISPATVRTHVERLLEKFECHDRTRLIAVALARGFLRPEELATFDGS